jgi:hypothetical protein
MGPFYLDEEDLEDAAECLEDVKVTRVEGEQPEVPARLRRTGDVLGIG